MGKFTAIPSPRAIPPYLHYRPGRRTEIDAAEHRERQREDDTVAGRLDHRTRRLLVLAITAALGRWEEFRLHLTSAVDAGLEWCDIEEALRNNFV